MPEVSNQIQKYSDRKSSLKVKTEKILRIKLDVQQIVHSTNPTRLMDNEGYRCINTKTHDIVCNRSSLTIRD